ncbi:MAG: YebC/PmpR family DNA-binding transcriptional regulator [candidate division NC10 bacterium]|nr:YebC/PmpR family DNA-binding transcriptional regulator [candidate division NC10 bacterium]
MSGHSKWHGIKHKKAKVDAQKGRIFTKIIREITVAARQGGGDPEGNPRLRTAILAARAVNMPQENIQRAIKKGTGELPGVAYEEYIYEGYGPGGVAVMVEVMTDNKNRTASEIRRIFFKNGGGLGESGCVGWMFEKKGLIQIDAKKADEEKLFSIALEAGAEDMRLSESTFEVITAPKDLEKVKEAIAKTGIEMISAEVTMLPHTTNRLEGKVAQQVLHLMEELEDHDDVQRAYANFDIPEEIMAAMTA